MAALDAAWRAAAAELRLERFFAKRDLATHLVAPDDFARALLPSGPGAPTHSPTLDGVPFVASTVIVADAVDELASVAQARARWPRRQVWGLHHHVVPLRVAKGRPKHLPPDGLRIDALRPFAIACLPRSGSTLLCEMLAAAGAGAPAEHLRVPMAMALSMPGVDRHEMWRQVAGHAARAGLFGTKLVTSFLDDAAARLGGAWDDVVAPLMAAGLRVIHLRRAPLDVAVSRHVAHVAGRYHVRGEMADDDRARFEAVPHDADRLRTLLAAAIDEADRLAQWVARLPAGRVIELRYDDLASDPTATLARALAFVGHAGDLAAVADAELPIRLADEVSAPGRIRERFLAELQATDAALARRALAA